MFHLAGGTVDPRAGIETRKLWQRVITEQSKVLVLPQACIGTETADSMRWAADFYHMLRAGIGLYTDPFMLDEMREILATTKVFSCGEDLDAAVRTADLIFVPGGDGDLLQYALKPYVEVLKTLRHEHKTVVGVSAGANMWAAEYYSNDNQRIMQGYNILNINTICHWSATDDQRQAATVLSERRPTVLLGDYTLLTIC